MSRIWYYLNLNHLIVADYRFIIIYHCPWTVKIGKAISLAKKLNKKVFFDIDDLVIDKKYTDFTPYVKDLNQNEKSIYDNRIPLMQKTLKIFDGAITTNEVLAKELKNYVGKVFINPNVATEEMFNLSIYAMKEISKKKIKGLIVIGYYSYNNNDNSDIEIITPIIIDIMKEYKNVKLMLLGEIKLPNDLIKFSSKIIRKTFVDRKNIPKLISRFDIHIAPIRENIFNAAKSENKWIDASLVKVPTIASNFGVFKQTIINGKTGILCTTIQDWYKELKSLITYENLRNVIAENAYKVCKEKYNTLLTGIRLSNYINSLTNKHIGFIMPSLDISGGIKVILVHASYLQDEGWDVDLFVPGAKLNIFEFREHTFNVIDYKKAKVVAQYDILVATFYATLFTVLNYPNVKRRLYLVQGYETDFYPYGNYYRHIAERTYSISFGVEYITISKWCESWLREKYRKNPKFAPNGIDLRNYKEHKRLLNKQKIRILIEGDNLKHYKNVDESFKIIDKLDKNKYEIWYMTYNGEPKSWYRIDKYLKKIPYEKVGEVYEQCDILIKSSWLESFSYPPLEMIATGGYCIVVSNMGNAEYLKDGENCLFYKLGDINSAVNCIEHLVSNEDLQQHLYENGLATAQKRDWRNFKDKILSLYED